MNLKSYIIILINDEIIYLNLKMRSEILNHYYCNDEQIQYEMDWQLVQYNIRALEQNFYCTDENCTHFFIILYEINNIKKPVFFDD